MKILIAGTHFTPAQAVIEELRKFPNIEIVYLGRKFTQEGDRIPSAESQVLPKLGIKFIPLIAGRLRRIFDIRTISSFFKIPIGLVQAFYIVFKEDPDAVLSFGGYIGFPAVFSAWLLSKPIIIHEQTLVSGLANTISGWFADKIAVSFNSEYTFDKKKTILTGNPIRKGLLNVEESPDRIVPQRNLPVIYVTGGNQGSHIINQVIEESLEKLTEKYFVIHQTGESKYKDFERLFELKKSMKHKERYILKKWFQAEELRSTLSKTYLAVSRAGANTLLELAYFGIPAIVVPLPYLYNNEQIINASVFRKLGLCSILKQEDLTSQKLLDCIQDVFKNYKKHKGDAKNAGRVVIKDSARRIAQEVMLLAEKAK